MAGAYNRMFNLRTLCLTEISGGSTNVKHTTDYPPLGMQRAKLKHLSFTATSGNFGQRRAIN